MRNSLFIFIRYENIIKSFRLHFANINKKISYKAGDLEENVWEYSFSTKVPTPHKGAEHWDKSWISLILLTKSSQFSRDISTFSSKVVMFSTTVQLMRKILEAIIKFFLSGVIVKNNHFMILIFQCVNLLFKIFIFIWNNIYCNFFYWIVWRSIWKLWGPLHKLVQKAFFFVT